MFAECVHVYGHLESICKRVYVQCEGCGVTCSSHAMYSVSCTCAIIAQVCGRVVCLGGVWT